MFDGASKIKYNKFDIYTYAYIKNVYFKLSVEILTVRGKSKDIILHIKK